MRGRQRLQACQVATELDKVACGVQPERTAVDCLGIAVSEAQMAIVELAVARPIAAAEPVVTALPAPALADAVNFFAAFPVEFVEPIGQTALLHTGAQQQVL
ncbi:hypothetical protein D3C81_1508680 [compost metagenome]